MSAPPRAPLSLLEGVAQDVTRRLIESLIERYSKGWISREDFVARLREMQVPEELAKQYAAEIEERSTAFERERLLLEATEYMRRKVITENQFVSICQGLGVQEWRMKEILDRERLFERFRK